MCPRSGRIACWHAAIIVQYGVATRWWVGSFSGVVVAMFRSAPERAKVNFQLAPGRQMSQNVGTRRMGVEH
jgi:hypothetical protein